MEVRAYQWRLFKSIVDRSLLINILFFSVFAEDIKVRFCETDQPVPDAGAWHAHATINYVHFQHGIALQTPKYKDGNLSESVRNAFVRRHIVDL